MNNILKNSGLWWVVGALAVVALIIFVASSPSTPGQTPDAKVNLEITPDDWTKGSEFAPVTLVEYGDFQCPACGAYEPMVKQLTVDFPETLRVVYRHFPLSQHRNAVPAAQAAEAAGLQAKFWEMHDLLFENQANWSELSDPKESFSKFADQLALDKAKYDTDFKSVAIKDKIDAASAQAFALRLDSTPTFFLNGARVSPRSYAEFKGLVETAVDQAPTL